MKIISKIDFPRNEKSENEESKNASLSEIYTLPVTTYMLGLFLIHSGKQSQFPFFTPFSKSLGLTGYEPAMILTMMNITDIVFRPLGGYFSGFEIVRKYGQSLFLSVFIGAIALMNLISQLVSF